MQPIGYDVQMVQMGGQNNGPKEGKCPRWERPGIISGRLWAGIVQGIEKMSGSSFLTQDYKLFV